MNRADLRNLPGLKRRDIKPCALCGQGVMHNNLLTFYRVSLEHYVVDLDAISRQHGFEQFMGNPAIAQAMGPDADLAKQLPGRDGPVTVCCSCAMQPGALMHIAELGGRSADTNESRS